MLEDCIKKGASFIVAMLLVLALFPTQAFASSKSDTNNDVPVTNATGEEKISVIAKDPLETDQTGEEKVKTKKLIVTKEANAKSASQADESPVVIVLAETEKEAEEDSSEAEEKVRDPRVAILNSATLNPQSPKSEDLDIFLHIIMEDIITDDMSTYAKIKACYDYIVSSTSYGSHTSRLGTPIGDVTCREITRNYGAVEGYGAVVLSTNVGLCNAYASAFILMANEIGLNAYLVKGYTRGAGGNYPYHEWAEVNIDGAIYTFDPQLEQNLTRAGLGQYNVFCTTYNQVGGRYSKL